MRPQPDWLISDDVDFTEVDLGRLKSGKEAEVFVVERSFAGRSCLLAHKRYRPRSVTHKGELEALGFQDSSRFVNDAGYRAGRTFAKSRDRRAAAGKSKYGRKLLATGWTTNELDALRTAWDAGVTVPYPVGALEDGLVMQYLGDLDGAAPRLAQARVSPADVRGALDQLVDNLQRLVGAGLVHADLSAYNLLWWRDQLWLIDFPQAVDVAVNPQALDLLHRDITNVCAWFARQGVDANPDGLYRDLVSIACAP